MTIQRKKLIEVSLPLKAINAASAREKSIRHGHPSTLHLWWARRPLATCRAVLFAQLVDDPSAWPEEFPTEEARACERKRLHRIIEDMVPWKATQDERILRKARYEIARSLARWRGDSSPAENDFLGVLDYLAKHAPPVCDPFCGGGSIPLEAQRLGLRAHGSDLNPVAVLVSKATCEIPPKFAGRAPVHPHVDGTGGWKGASGLAEDIRRYGKWLRDEAQSRIGQLYPEVRVTEKMAVGRDDLRPYVGQDLTVIAWLWARTVASPNPILRGAHVPLVRSFVLSSKKGRRAWVEPVLEGTGRYWLTVRVGPGAPPAGTVARRGGRCLLTGSPMPFTHIRAEAKAGRMGTRPMAVVVEGTKGRVYLDATKDMDAIAGMAQPAWKSSESISHWPGRTNVVAYGLTTWGDLFTDRQLVAFTTFSDLVAEAREKVLADALAAGMDLRTRRLADGGTGAEAYADAVATYLGLALDRSIDRGSTICSWDKSRESLRNTFGRQAIPMVWDFAESNPFSGSSGNYVGQ